MNWRDQWRVLLLLVAGFLVCFFLPLGSQRFEQGILEALHLVRWYAREHVVLCLIPAFFIAGAIAVFISSASVMKYLGAQANKVTAYSVAAVSGTVLAVCSCTILPLFAGIHRMGAGLGPATTFLYAGPAINILAVILTARVLGVELGAARAVGAIVFSIVIGVSMHFIFLKDELVKAKAAAVAPVPPVARPLWQNLLFFLSMIIILVFANWARPETESGLWYQIHAIKWGVVSVAAFGLGSLLIAWFGFRWYHLALAAAPVVALGAMFPAQPLLPFGAGVVGLSVLASRQGGEGGEWFSSTWGYTKQILPLLFYGVLVAGALLGRPETEGWIPAEWVSRAVGGNSLGANLFASVAGAFMYFATLTEVPILQGLLGNGMGKGPALALLLAGPALSLPNMLVIRSVMGTKRTVVFVLLVMFFATISGLIYGNLF
jgi:uncharacterized protein